MFEYRFYLNKVITPAILDVNIDLGFDVSVNQLVVVKNYAHYPKEKHPRLYELELEYMRNILEQKTEKRLISFGRDHRNRRQVVIFLSEGKILNDKIMEYHNIIKNYR